MGRRQICFLALPVVAPVSAVLVGQLGLAPCHDNLPGWLLFVGVGLAAAIAIYFGFHEFLFV